MIQRLRKVHLGNKGFSLVELIIVIAIMAILIAVLAPMFVRYVERSRISRDAQAAGQMVQALKTIISDPTVVISESSIGVTWAPSGWTWATGPAAAQSMFSSTVGSTGAVLGTSNTFRNGSNTIRLSIIVATGEVTVGHPFAGTNDNTIYFSNLLDGIS